MFIKTKDLPLVVQSVLANHGFHKQDIKVEVTETFDCFCSGSEGSRGYVSIIDLSDNSVREFEGSWGGANMFNPHNRVDKDQNEYPMLENLMVIKGTEGYVKTASVLVHPSNMAKMIPSSDTVEMSYEETVALNIINSHVTRGRVDEFHRIGFGHYSTNNKLVCSLKDKGMVKFVGNGVQLTLEGKNFVETHKVNVY